jgi:hypothetical protein
MFPGEGGSGVVLGATPAASSHPILDVSSPQVSQFILFVIFVDLSMAS